MRNVLFLTFVITVTAMCGLKTVAQNVKFYAHIPDKELIPEKENSKPDEAMKFKSKNSKMDELVKKYKPQKFEKAFPTAKTDWLREVYLVECDTKEFGEKLKENFKKSIPLVEYLGEPELLADYYTPNDYHPYQTNLDLIKVKDVYDCYKNLPKVPIALTDTYFPSHEDLNYLAIWGSNTLPSYKPEHGTMVSGFISAITDNNIGIASVGYNTRLMASSNWASENEVLLLAQAGYRVINCSWVSRCSYSSIEDGVYQEIRNDWNAIVVCGAGNRSCGAGSALCYPASYDVNISATAITSGTNPDWHEQTPGDPLTAYQHNDKVDICAPGYNVYTTDLMGAAGISSGNYASGWGTSFSSPQVAGTLGVIFTINPCLTANQAEAILLNATDASLYSKSQNASYIGLLGRGRLDVKKAVEAAAASATKGIGYYTYTTDQVVAANYAITLTNVTINLGADVTFKARKEITITGNFQIGTGSNCTFEANPNFPVVCN